MAALLCAAYWIVAAIVPGDVIIQTLNFIVVFVAVAVAVAYLPTVISAIKADRLDRVTQLTVGIVLSWTSTLLLRGSSNAIRIFDADWLVKSPALGFFLYLAILSGVLHITAPGAVDGKIPERNWIIIGVSIGAGCLVAGVLIGFNLKELLPT